MNTVFVFIFAYFPYHVGAFTARSLGILDSVDVSNFEGVVSTLLGYIIIGVALVFLHSIAKMVKFKRTQKILGQCYVGLKVALLFVFELGIFPLIFGIWFDVCSLVSLIVMMFSGHHFIYLFFSSQFLEPHYPIGKRAFVQPRVHPCSSTGS